LFAENIFNKGIIGHFEKCAYSLSGGELDKNIETTIILGFSKKLNYSFKCQNEEDQLAWTVQRYQTLASYIQGLVTVLTIMWDYSPGHGRCIYSPNHPEHAEPTEVLSTLLLGQKFRIVGKHDGDRATNPAKITNQLSIMCFRV